MNVAFLGLGIMGSRMARHIARAGHPLTVWNRSPGPRQAAADAGIATSNTAAAAVADADIVITMLATPEVVTEVMLGSGGVLKAMKPGAVWADSSTVSPAYVRQSAASAAERGVRFLSIPVAGTREPAEAGQLKVLVGGPAELLEEVRPVLESYSAGIIHVGEEIDRGAAFKILINGMLAQSMLVFSETVKLGEAMGLDQAFLLRALPGLPVIAPFVASKVEMIRSGDYTDASFPLELMHKDLNLVVETAYATDQPALLAAAAREVYGRAKQAGRGREDFAGVHGV